MSLRTRTSSLPQVSRPRVRSRIPIARIPQPREEPDGRDVAAGQAGSHRRGAAVAQSRNSGGWFVAGASGDVGRKESVTRTIAGREVVFWRNSAAPWSPGRARARTSGRCWTSARWWTARCTADGTASH